MNQATIRKAVTRATAGRLFAWRHELAFPSLGIRYTYIPKNGCSSFKLTLGRAEGWLAPGDDPHSISIRHRLEGKVLTRNAKIRFVVLRDPLSRLASAFLDRFSKEQDEATSRLVAQGLLRPGERLADVTFERFAGFISRQRHEEMDPHWRRQADFVRGEYTHYVDFGTLGRGLELLREHGLEIHQHRPHATSAYRPYGGPASELPAGELLRLRAEEGRVPTTDELASEDVRELARMLYEADYSLIDRVSFV